MFENFKRYDFKLLHNSTLPITGWISTPLPDTWTKMYIHSLTHAWKTPRFRGLWTKKKTPFEPKQPKLYFRYIRWRITLWNILYFLQIVAELYEGMQ